MSARQSKSVFPAILAFVLVMVPSATVQAALYDDFNDNSTNPTLWTVKVYGSGASVAEANQRLETSLAANAANGPEGLFGGAYWSNAVFQGDLDVWVDFELLDWPAANGVRTVLKLIETANFDNEYAFHGWNVERASAGRGEFFGEVYATDFNGSIATTPTSDQSGKLRLTRIGTTLSAYYFAGGEWQLLGNGAVTSADLRFGIGFGSNDTYFNDQAVKVAFDNVNVTGTVVPVPPAAWLLGSGLLGLLGVGRRKSQSALTKPL
jgi:hypothetical protein